LAGLVTERLVRRPGASVGNLQAETFTALCVEAAAAPGGWAELRARFRDLELFVLEDLHVLQRAPMALAELAHTLDALGDAGAAVAVSTRTGPAQWMGWPRRLVNRLVGGLVVRIDPPSLTSRRQYLLDRATTQSIGLTAEAVETLAEAADGYRTLDGWLSRLALSGRVHRQRLDHGLAERLLANDGTISDASIEQVARAVAARFSIRLEELRSSSRRQAIVVPRHLAMHLARTLTRQSYRAIGSYFGHRDPATVRHACKAATARLAADPALAAAVVVISQPLLRP
jgi:chromosomal replication initiator protein